uniref:Uncharacterized protein n=1 Tax=Lepeophtheirus salmonis TaxID=72036 RepID=A0A0K2VJ69_LEPSM
MDVVAPIPVTQLNAEFLYNKYTVIKLPLSNQIYRCGLIRFIVVAVLVDNHPVNRKFFTHFLCGDELQTYITHTTSLKKFISSSTPYTNLKIFIIAIILQHSPEQFRS